MPKSKENCVEECLLINSYYFIRLLKWNTIEDILKDTESTKRLNIGSQDQKNWDILKRNFVESWLKTLTWSLQPTNDTKERKELSIISAIDTLILKASTQITRLFTQSIKHTPSKPPLTSNLKREFKNPLNMLLRKCRLITQNT